MKTSYWWRLCNLANILSESLMYYKWLMYYLNNFWRKFTRGCQNHIRSLRICAIGIGLFLSAEVHRAPADDKSGLLCLLYLCLAVIPPVFQNEFKYTTYCMIWTRWSHLHDAHAGSWTDVPNIVCAFRFGHVGSLTIMCTPLPLSFFLLLFVSVFRAALCRQFWLAKFRNSVRPPLWLKPENRNNYLITHGQRHEDNSLRGHSRFLVHS